MLLDTNSVFMKQHFTKQKGSLAEQAVILQLLKRDFHVSVPLGDFLPYDLIVDNGSRLLKIQVKGAWWDQGKENYVVDNRRTKTNRRVMRRSNYQDADFDFAILYIPDVDISYIMPSPVFNAYGSEIHLVESDKRQRKPRSAQFREAWQLLT